ncbi:MAG TPA: TIGR03084 family metal-binding protein [Myxococcota bacterium]|nr:TIGR03084 family metal-binding protein [Myxococcota bacterium]
MLEEATDFRAEADELHAFLCTLDARDWSRPTTFQRWTPWDVVAHLHLYDQVSLASLAGEEVFSEQRKKLVGAIGRGVTNADLARDRFGALGPAELLASWIAGARGLAAELAGSDPKRRLPWFGPDMGVRMFTTARLMETWAHGQEVYDLVRAPRAHTDRLRHIAEIGVRTFAWTFVNRKLEVPGPPPYVRLIAPSGAIWEWNGPSETSAVRGTAVDFCRTVTQVRNVADTRLEVIGDVAQAWMVIAQCFAGGAVDPPKPGERASW